MDNESMDDFSRLSFASEGGVECFELMHENGEELSRLGPVRRKSCHAWHQQKKEKMKMRQSAEKYTRTHVPLTHHIGPSIRF
jgi:hypothetical protein